ncbi:hypothetical protein NFI96_017482 [Prochilodus magdalenae]|nr:hypothetical protein NFI96_017482 [Prochilodus magdalenae]
MAASYLGCSGVWVVLRAACLPLRLADDDYNGVCSCTAGVVINTTRPGPLNGVQTGRRDGEERNSVHIHGPENNMNINSEKKSQRKPSKPLLERRRRARINACLGELRTLLLQSHVTQLITWSVELCLSACVQQLCCVQGCHPSKLEKADILELTVRHLRSLQHRPSGQEHVRNTTSTQLESG